MLINGLIHDVTTYCRVSGLSPHTVSNMRDFRLISFPASLSDIFVAMNENQYIFIRKGITADAIRERFDKENNRIYKLSACHKAD